MRYRRRQCADEAELRERLRALAGQRPRWGYRRVARAAAARARERAINRKRVYRLYRLEGLAVRRRKRKRVAVVPRGVVARTWTRGQAWAMDFMQDVLVDGRRFRTLNVLDTVTRECLAIEVDTSLPGQRVIRVLDQLVPGMARRSQSPWITDQSSPAWPWTSGPTRGRHLGLHRAGQADPERAC